MTFALFREAVQSKFQASILRGIAASALTVFSSHGNELKCSALLGAFGVTPDSALVVVVPQTFVVVHTTMPGDQLFAAFLPHPAEFAYECFSIVEWRIDSVHVIPLIHMVMNECGKRTSGGKILWRVELKQIASTLVNGSFGPPSPTNHHKEKASILMGLPGSGKSTLLWLLVFHLVMEHKKNVLVVAKQTQGNHLLYLGYEREQVVYFSVPLCGTTQTISIYGRLPSAWLLLERFNYKKNIPLGLKKFELVATAQLVRLSAEERLHSYCFTVLQKKPACKR